MESPQPAVDMVIVGAGILGLYQLYRARRDGYSVACSSRATASAAPGTGTATRAAGSTPRATPTATCSPTELWQEWDWSEEFAAPAGDRALPQPRGRQVRPAPAHPVQQPGRLRRLGREATLSWTTAPRTGSRSASRYLIAATGVLSVPSVPGRARPRGLRGRVVPPGRWPAEPVDFRGKRVAVVGTGSSGVQIAPVIADEVASLTVYQRTPTWCTPLNNHPITPSSRPTSRPNFEPIRPTLDASVSGFLHQAARRRHLRGHAGAAVGVLRDASGTAPASPRSAATTRT